MEIEVGNVVICGTGQAGTFVGIEANQACVLLANGCLWYGHPGQMYLPTAEVLAVAPVDVDRFVGR